MDGFDKPRLGILTLCVLVIMVGLKFAFESRALKHEQKVSLEEKIKKEKLVKINPKIKKIHRQKQRVANSKPAPVLGHSFGSRAPASVNESSNTSSIYGTGISEEIPEEIPPDETSSDERPYNNTPSRNIVGGGSVVGGSMTTVSEDIENKKSVQSYGTSGTRGTGPISNNFSEPVLVQGPLDLNVPLPTNHPSPTIPNQTVPSGNGPVLLITLSTSKASGTYLAQPHISLYSTGADVIKYCVGPGPATSNCCNPDTGAIYSGAFYPGSADGNYCVSAKGYRNGLVSSHYNWNYLVDPSVASLNISLPQRTHFQTQQLFQSMNVNSDEFGDSSLTFFQRITRTDPGATACDVLDFTSPLDDMNSTLGSIVNFGGVSAPFQIPLRLDNKIDYGTNFLVSIIERSVMRAPASFETEYVCLQNSIQVNDFHIDGVSASAGQEFPSDGSYTLQGGLNFMSSLNSSGEAVGSNGVVLEHGFINIIN